MERNLTLQDEVKTMREEMAELRRLIVSILIPKVTKAAEEDQWMTLKEFKRMRGYTHDQVRGRVNKHKHLTQRIVPKGLDPEKFRGTTKINVSEHDRIYC